MGGQGGRPRVADLRRGRARRPLRGVLRRHGRRRRRGPAGPAPGPDAEVTLRLTLAEAAFGVDAVARRPAPRRPARTADATGAAPGTTRRRATDCQGHRRGAPGAPVDPRPDGHGVAVPAVPRARGRRSPRRARRAAARGARRPRSTLTVDVPAGVEDGSTMRLGGRGRRGVPRRAERDAVRAPRRRARRALRAARRRPAHVASVSLAQAALGRDRRDRDARGRRDDRGRARDPARHGRRGCASAASRTFAGAGAATCSSTSQVAVPTELDEESESMLRSLASPPRRGGRRAAHAGLFSRLRSRR